MVAAATARGGLRGGAVCALGGIGQSGPHPGRGETASLEHYTLWNVDELAWSDGAPSTR